MPGDGHVFREGGRIQVRARIPAIRGNMSARHVYSDEFRHTLSKEFHTYSMEWEKDDSFSYWIDNRRLMTWKDSFRPDGHRIKKDDGTRVENRILTPAHCGPTTDWQNLQRAAGEVTVENVCGP